MTESARTRVRDSGECVGRTGGGDSASLEACERGLHERLKVQIIIDLKPRKQTRCQWKQKSTRVLVQGTRESELQPRNLSLPVLAGIDGPLSVKTSKIEDNRIFPPSSACHRPYNHQLAYSTILCRYIEM